MKKLKDLKASDFPGVNPEKFYEWKKVSSRTATKAIIVMLIYIIAIIFRLISGVLGIVIAFALMIFVIYLMSRKSNRLFRELGITREELKRTKLGIPTEPLKPTQNSDSLISGKETTKKCPQCAEWIKLEALVCRYCSYTFDPEKVKKEIIIKQQEDQDTQAKLESEHIQEKTNTKLSILKIILYIATGLVAFLTFSVFIVLITGASPEDIMFQVITFVVCLVFAVLWCSSAWGIGKRKVWARKLAIVTGFCSIIVFPLGTILGIYILIVMFSKDITKIFRE